MQSDPIGNMPPMHATAPRPAAALRPARALPPARRLYARGVAFLAATVISWAAAAGLVAGVYLVFQQL